MKKFFTTERLMLAFVVVGGFVGIWHALPLVNIIFDEMYYVGGVFRAFEAKSVLPLPGDVPYGTLTFYLNYILEIPFVILLLAYKSFHLEALKSFLILHVEVAYLVPRLLSAALAAGFAIFYNRFLRLEGVSLPMRAAALAAMYLTLVPAVILHTGKMWVLSVLLVSVSMLYTYRALRRHAAGELGKDIYMSVIPAFLAVVNFPFMLPFLVVIPLLGYFFRRDRAQLKTLAWAAVWGAIAFLCLFGLNASNYLSLIQLVFTGYHPLIDTGEAVFQISLLESIRLHAWQLILIYPLALLLIVYAAVRGLIQHKLLFYISLGYAVLYFAALSLLATYYSDPLSFLRYLFPFAIFLSGMIASLNYQKIKYIVWVFIAVQVCVYLFLLYLLSIPTTFNLARDYVIKNYSNEPALIYNDLVELDLPQNSSSALLTVEASCATKCQYLRHTSTASFVPVVTDLHSNLASSSAVFAKYFWIGEARSDACVGTPVAAFTSGVPDSKYFTIEYRLGSYFEPDFWHLLRLGKNVYIYQVTAACFKNLYASK